MKCSCGEELNEKWTLCPFCGKEVPKKPKSLDEVLKNVVDEYGPRIFKEEYSNRLDRLMSDWPEELADNRDVIKLLQIKSIPDSLASALDMPAEERGSVIKKCATLLTDKFGIKGDVASNMLSIITNAIDLKCDSELADVNDDTFVDPRDGQVYKTCKIGDQVWMAENLKYDVGEESIPFDNNFKYFDDFGLLYTPSAAVKAVPEGWHLPSEEEIREMLKFLSRKYKCKNPGKHLIAKDYDGCLDSENFHGLLGGNGETFGGWQCGPSSNFYGLNECGYIWGLGKDNRELYLIPQTPDVCLALVPSSYGFVDIGDDDSKYIAACGSYLIRMASVRLIKD